MAKKVTLPSIELVLQLMKDGTLPTLEQAKQALRDKVYQFNPNQVISHSATRRVIKQGDDAGVTVDLDNSKLR